MTGLPIFDLDSEVEGCIACGVLGIDITAVSFDEEVDVLDGVAQDTDRGWTMDARCRVGPHQDEMVYVEQEDAEKRT